MKKKILTVAAIAVFGAVPLTACGAKWQEYGKDAARGSENSSPADTVDMPDGFSNLATKCDHGNRIYAAYHGDSAYAAISVVPNDPSCT